MCLRSKRDFWKLEKRQKTAVSKLRSSRFLKTTFRKILKQQQHWASPRSNLFDFFSLFARPTGALYCLLRVLASFEDKEKIFFLKFDWIEDGQLVIFSLKSMHRHKDGNLWPKLRLMQYVELVFDFFLSKEVLRYFLNGGKFLSLVARADHLTKQFAI